MVRLLKGASLLLALTLVLAGCQVKRSPSGFRLPDGNAEAGKAAFVDLQCATCHTVKGVDLPAPQMSPAVALGGSSVLPKTDGEYVTDIILPSSHFASGYAGSQVQDGSKSKMPDYASRITIRQLADLVAFLQRR